MNKQNWVAKNKEKLDQFKRGQKEQQTNYLEFQKKVDQKHHMQSFNTIQTKKGNLLNNEEKKECNLLRHYDVNTNKFKEDVKHENFKKHVIGAHMRQQLQVKEKQLNRMLLQNLQQNNQTLISNQNSLQSQYIGYTKSKRNLHSDVQRTIISKLRPNEDEDPEEVTSETLVARKKFRKELQNKVKFNFK